MSTERPILFSGPMVRAILDGRKTQTRRVLKGSTEFKGPYNPDYLEAHKNSKGWASICPYGAPGDRLWVRETFAWPGEEEVFYRAEPDHARFVAEYMETKYKVNNNYPPIRWQPSIHMPRVISRITLEITDVRVQRLQEITEEDAIAEGSQIPCSELPAGPCQQAAWTERQAFSRIWDSINGKTYPWKSNPWVWAITFRRAK